MPDWNDPAVKATTATSVLETIREIMADPDFDDVRRIERISDAIPDEFLPANRPPSMNANVATTAQRLREAGWPSVADDIEAGYQSETVLARLSDIGEGDSIAAEIVRALAEGRVR
jgi:phosphoenolpyruvate synthase/pyruvate phosphate dikinase